MTMGTSMLCASLSLTSHSCPEIRILGGLKYALLRQIGDTESRGLSRCESCCGFYPALHHVSNERGSHLPFDLSDSLTLRSRDRFRHRRLRFFLRQLSFQATGTTSLPVLPGRAGRPEGGQGP